MWFLRMFRKHRPFSEVWRKFPEGANVHERNQLTIEDNMEFFSKIRKCILVYLLCGWSYTHYQLKLQHPAVPAKTEYNQEFAKNLFGWPFFVADSAIKTIVYADRYLPTIKIDQ